MLYIPKRKAVYLLSIFTGPDGDRCAPVAVSGHCPVSGFSQPVAKPLLLHKVWHPGYHKNQFHVWPTEHTFWPTQQNTFSWRTEHISWPTKNTSYLMDVTFHGKKWKQHIHNFKLTEQMYKVQVYITVNYINIFHSQQNQYNKQESYLWNTRRKISTKFAILNITTTNKVFLIPQSSTSHSVCQDSRNQQYRYHRCSTQQNPPCGQTHLALSAALTSRSSCCSPAVSPELVPPGWTSWALLCRSVVSQTCVFKQE